MKIDKESKTGIKLLKKFGAGASCANCAHCTSLPMKPSVCLLTGEHMFSTCYFICSKWQFQGDLAIWKARQKGVKNEG